jgi:hypothetical protein
MDVLDQVAPPPAQEPPPSCRVHEIRQILIWPLELMHPAGDVDAAGPQHAIAALKSTPGSPWAELDDEFPEDPRQFQERHYREFVAFHPHVQRFLYGTRAAGSARPGQCDSPLRIFRRRDIAEVRVVLGDRAPPVTLDVAHVDLYFFHDVDVAILIVEVGARGMPMPQAQDLVFKLGRAYPNGWTENGRAAHCPERVEWLGRDGGILAASDFEKREKYLAAVCRERAPAIASHWEYLLAPLELAPETARNALGVRLVEYYRMPQMVFLAVADPRAVTTSDFVRLGLAQAPGDPQSTPFAPAFLEDFARRYCYDRYHDPLRGGAWVDTRVMCSGHTFVLVGDARQPLVTDAERGVLARFRHQYFLLGLIAHFHRAALLMLSDRFVRIVNRLDVDRPATIQRFRAEVRATHEVFLRFTHRYWFSEVTDQAVGRDLFRMWSSHLETERLYAGVREEIQDMSQYLDSDMLRRTSRTMVRLTVVAILSLIGTATTGFLGMNLIDGTGVSLPLKVLLFAVVASLATALTIYTVMKARRLAGFLDALADERLTWRRKLTALLGVWRRE